MKRMLQNSPDLMLFTYLVEYKSFTALADRLDMNKSVISKRIKNLEDELKTQLFIRSTRRLELTETGRLLYDRTRDMHDNFHSIYSEISDLAKTPQGTLRISAPSNFALEHLTPLISEFSKTHPNIKYKLMIGRSYQELIKNRIDLGFHIGPLNDSNLVARKLASRKLVVCATPSYLKKHGTPTAPQDLSSHNCLSLIHNKETAQWHFTCSDGQVIDVDIAGNFHATSTQVLKAAALNHMGIINIPAHAITQELRSKQLSIILPDYTIKNIDIYALYAQTRHLPNRARLLLDFIVERFETKDYWPT